MTEYPSILQIQYEKLKTKITPLAKNSDDFNILQKYVANGQGGKADIFRIVDAFNIEREGESERFEPCKSLGNVQLLWHGSRVSNFIGILSQGLRIAPPEAPVSGYMFGKGIYFADLATKSSGYCCPYDSDSMCLLLLSEVALGNMYEIPESEYMEKPPAGKNSTKGLGAYIPDPKESITYADVNIPWGKPIEIKKKDLYLHNNEYIVYDVAQVKQKYLLKVKWGPFRDA